MYPQSQSLSSAWCAGNPFRVMGAPVDARFVGCMPGAGGCSVSVRRKQRKLRRDPKRPPPWSSSSPAGGAQQLDACHRSHGRPLQPHGRPALLRAASGQRVRRQSRNRINADGSITSLSTGLTGLRAVYWSIRNQRAKHLIFSEDYGGQRVSHGLRRYNPHDLDQRLRQRQRRSGRAWPWRPASYSGPILTPGHRAR